MSEETHYCFYHPTTPTSLRCNRCGKYICIRDARRTPVGYRCKDCVREQQSVYFNANSLDYVIAAVVALPLSYIGALIASELSWLSIFVGLIGGGLIAEAVRIATRKRRGRYTWLVVLGCMVFASLLRALALPGVQFMLSFGLPAELSGAILLNLLWVGVYLVVGAGVMVTRLRYS
jgi:hypothetical protein